VAKRCSSEEKRQQRINIGSISISVAGIENTRKKSTSGGHLAAKSSENSQCDSISESEKAKAAKKRKRNGE